MYTVILSLNRVYNADESTIHILIKDTKNIIVVNSDGNISVNKGNPITWPTDAKNGLQAIVDVKAGTLRFARPGSPWAQTEFVVSECVADSAPVTVTEHDPVNRPSHYTDGSIECIDAIKASMSTEAFLGFLKGNVQKYMWRYEKKVAPVEDLKKAQWYLSKLIEEQEQSC